MVGGWGGGGVRGGGAFMSAFVKRDQCTALCAVQHPSMTPTSLLGLGG